MKDEEDDIKYDIREARCTGLANRVALQVNTNKKVLAKEVTKADEPFICPGCLSDAIVRKCSEKVDHFAHHARYSKTLTGKDRVLHEKCCNEICDYLNEIYPYKWKREVKIPKSDKHNTPELVPDVCGRLPNGTDNGIPVAIEVQKSAYTINRIFKKTVDYHKRGIYVLWVVPLREDLGKEFFRPRLYEKFLHSMYYGRVYYYLPNKIKKIIPVHYSPAKRWIEQNTWFDTEIMEKRTEGGFFLTYKTIKEPNYGDLLDIAYDFKSSLNTGFEHKNVKKNVPECKICIDTLEKWWDKNEYKDLGKQYEVIKNSNIYDGYDNFDDYDDINYGDFIET